MQLVDLKAIADDERVHWALFLLLGWMVVYPEAKFYIGLLFSMGAGIADQFSRLTRVINDFRSGRFYKPWKPAAPIITVSTKKQIAELSEASCLSQRAVYADMFGFKHTMNKLEHNTSDHKVIRTRLYSRVLHVDGPNHLQCLYPYLHTQLDRCLSDELRGGREFGGGVVLHVAPTVRRLASKLMSVMFFGEALASNDEFSNALLQYPRDMVRCMAAFQITPSFMSPLVHRILTNNGKAMRLIQQRIFECVGLGRSTWGENDPTKQFTIMHNMTTMTETSDYWNPELLSQSLLGIWFAASHQPWMNLHFVILELCVRKEWQTRLRQELKQYSPLNYGALEKLPLLDSFIKETVRLHPLDTLAIRRKSLEPYTFTEGNVSVPAGSTVCVSAFDLMHNPETYPNPDSFEPTRFVPKDKIDQQRRFTEVSETFPVWGYGSLACPGRLHASLAIKMVLSQLLLKYDLQLKDENARRMWSWETFAMPYESTQIILSQL